MYWDVFCCETVFLKKSTRAMTGNPIDFGLKVGDAFVNGVVVSFE